MPSNNDVILKGLESLRVHWVIVKDFRDQVRP